MGVCPKTDTQAATCPRLPAEQLTRDREAQAANGRLVQPLVEGVAAATDEAPQAPAEAQEHRQRALDAHVLTPNVDLDNERVRAAVWCIAA